MLEQLLPFTELSQFYVTKNLDTVSEARKNRRVLSQIGTSTTIRLQDVMLLQDPTLPDLVGSPMLFLNRTIPPACRQCPGSIGNKRGLLLGRLRMPEC